MIKEFYLSDVSEMRSCDITNQLNSHIKSINLWKEKHVATRNFLTKTIDNYEDKLVNVTNLWFERYKDLERTSKEICNKRSNTINDLEDRLSKYRKEIKSTNILKNLWFVTAAILFIINLF